MKNIGFATYKNSPLLITEDQPLVPLLKTFGIKASPIDWEEPLPREIDAVVLRSCWNSHLKPKNFITWVEALDVPLWNPSSVIVWNQNKTHLLELQKRGCDFQKLMF